jgi:hypothetical protein
MEGGAFPSGVPMIFDAMNFVSPLKFRGVTIGAFTQRAKEEFS